LSKKILPQELYRAMSVKIMQLELYRTSWQVTATGHKRATSDTILPMQYTELHLLNATRTIQDYICPAMSYYYALSTVSVVLDIYSRCRICHYVVVHVFILLECCAA
jgi:hypothetical protein